MKLYVEPYKWRPKLQVVELKGVEWAERESLQEHITVEEVLSSMKNLAGDKAMGRLSMNLLPKRMGLP